jgi:hypothetical protein
MKTNLIPVLLVAYVITNLTHAQTSLNLNLTEPIKVKRIAGGINFDGIPDEEVWQQTEALPMVMCIPIPGSTPSELTIVKMGYDDEYLYV